MSIAIKILVVDDEPQIRKFLRSSFSGTEYKVIEAEDGESGLRLAGTELHDVILLDLGLPDIDGVDVAKQIREWSQVPIIVLTARNEARFQSSSFRTEAMRMLTSQHYRRKQMTG